MFERLGPSHYEKYLSIYANSVQRLRGSNIIGGMYADDKAIQEVRMPLYRLHGSRIDLALAYLKTLETSSRIDGASGSSSSAPSADEESLDWERILTECARPDICFEATTTTAQLDAAQSAPPSPGTPCFSHSPMTTGGPDGDSNLEPVSAAQEQQSSSTTVEPTTTTVTPSSAPSTTSDALGCEASATIEPTPGAPDSLRQLARRILNDAIAGLRYVLDLDKWNYRPLYQVCKLSPPPPLSLSLSLSLSLPNSLRLQKVRCANEFHYR